MNSSIYKVVFTLLLITTFLFGKFIGGFISWFLFYTVLILFIYIWLVVKYSFKHIVVKRNLKSSRLTAGDTIEIEIEITNRSEFPHPYIMVVDDQPSKLKSHFLQNRFLIYPWFRSKSFIRYTIPNTKRGIHKWKEIELISGDLFGLIKIRRKILVHSELIVYPKSFSINKFYSRNERNIGTTFSQNKLSEDTASVIGIREYRKGDRFNRIHWKQSAKTMQLMTKEFERLITNDFMIILNQENGVYSSVNSNHFEYAVELAASIAKYATENRFSTGLISSVGMSKKIIPLSRSREHIIRIFEVLALAEANISIPFVETVNSELPFYQPGVTLAIITPIMDEKLYYLLGELAAKKIKVEVFVVSEFNKSVGGRKDSLHHEFNISVHEIPVGYWQGERLVGGISFG